MSTEATEAARKWLDKEQYMHRGLGISGRGEKRDVLIEVPELLAAYATDENAKLRALVEVLGKALHSEAEARYSEDEPVQLTTEFALTSFKEAGFTPTNTEGT